MKKFIFLYSSVLLSIFITQTVYSQVPLDEIDSTLTLCLDSAQNQSTHGMLGCIRRAEEQYDKELNYYYKKLFIDKNIKRVQLNQLPIKKVGIDEQFKFIKPVDEIIELNNERKKTNERGPLQKIDLKIKSISKKIDLLVYNLYSITKKEADNIDKEIGANSFSS